jgi:hypothetical protein
VLYFLFPGFHSLIGSLNAIAEEIRRPRSH